MVSARKCGAEGTKRCADSAGGKLFGRRADRLLSWDKTIFVTSSLRVFGGREAAGHPAGPVEGNLGDIPLAGGSRFVERPAAGRPDHSSVTVPARFFVGLWDHIAGSERLGGLVCLFVVWAHVPADTSGALCAGRGGVAPKNQTDQETVQLDIADVVLPACAGIMCVFGSGGSAAAADMVSRVIDCSCFFLRKNI